MKKNKGKQKAEEARSSTAFKLAQEEFKKLGQRLAKIRKSQVPKITQQIIADEGNFSYDYISRIERGEARPSMEALCEIALVLGVEVKNFFVDPEEVGTWDLKPQSLIVELENKEGQKIEKKFTLTNCE